MPQPLGCVPIRATSRLRRMSDILVTLELVAGRACAGRIEIPCMRNDATSGAVNAPPLARRISVARLPWSSPLSASSTFRSCSLTTSPPQPAPSRILSLSAPKVSIREATCRTGGRGMRETSSSRSQDAPHSHREAGIKSEPNACCGLLCRQGCFDAADGGGMVAEREIECPGAAGQRRQRRDRPAAVGVPHAGLRDQELHQSRRLHRTNRRESSMVVPQHEYTIHPALLDAPHGTERARVDVENALAVVIAKARRCDDDLHHRCRKMRQRGFLHPAGAGTRDGVRAVDKDMLVAFDLVAGMDE